MQFICRSVTALEAFLLITVELLLIAQFLL